jgi:hypothetical protein
MSRLGSELLLALAALVSILVLGAASGAEKPAAVFEGKQTLLRPAAEAYREWVFVGSSLGLRYDERSDKSAAPASATPSEHFNNVYINPAAFREFTRTGTFPDGTIFILEIARAEKKAEPGLQGSYPKEFTALEASVKDSSRFETGWAYFSFDAANGQRKDKATPLPKSRCFDCHHEKAAIDHVFTQFYPILRAARRSN